MIIAYKLLLVTRKGVRIEVCGEHEFLVELFVPQRNDCAADLLFVRVALGPLRLEGPRGHFIRLVLLAHVWRRTNHLHFCNWRGDHQDLVRI
jgi:hypothetical protein